MGSAAVQQVNAIRERQSALNVLLHDQNRDSSLDELAKCLEQLVYDNRGEAKRYFVDCAYGRARHVQAPAVRSLLVQRRSSWFHRAVTLLRLVPNRDAQEYRQVPPSRSYRSIPHDRNRDGVVGP